MNRPGRAGETDGRLFAATEEDVFPGAALRMVNGDGSAAPFSDFLVTKVVAVGAGGAPVRRPEDDPRHGVQVTVSRPYAFVSGAGTTCPSVLTGVETTVVDMATITKKDSLFRVAATARGDVCEYTT